MCKEREVLDDGRLVGLSEGLESDVVVRRTSSSLRNRHGEKPPRAAP